MPYTVPQQNNPHRAIQILPPQLANQIAAGEVVERPASVVKELIENSLDADASEILIEIEQGGQKRILIRDNGKGIAKEELALALSRHATSKITNIDDLEHITSMGFRGEALASISSVSRLSLTSKPKSQSEAWQAVAEGQQMEVEVTPAAHPDGTSIEVLDLFFNTPARRKFLRSGKTEFQHIENIVKRIALARPDVQFVLSHNQKVQCRYTRVQDISKRIEQVCGKNMLQNATQVDYAFEGISVTGWCSQLGYGVATRDMQYTFVNGRMMKDKLLAHALRQVYEETLPPNTFASFVLYLQVAPEQIDVNVHPAKHEVRFHQARQVHDVVYKAVNDAISSSTSGFVGDDLHSQGHNYIQPLVDANLATSSVDGTGDVESDFRADLRGNVRQSIGAGGRSTYRSEAPTRGEIKANHDFYASMQTNNGDSSQVVEQSANVGPQTQNISSFTCNSYLYADPFIVIANGSTLQVLAIEKLLTQVIATRLEKTTLPQPLLMPISTANENNINTKQLDRIADQFFVIAASHQKLILKQVPSELRHLPWASIFGQLPLHELCKQMPSIMASASAISKAWLNTIELSPNILDGWMKELGQNALARLFAREAEFVDLLQWLSRSHDQKPD